MNYGFCFANNRYDSYAIRMKMNPDLKGNEFTEEIRLKTN